MLLRVDYLSSLFNPLRILFIFSISTILEPGGGACPLFTITVNIIENVIKIAVEITKRIIILVNMPLVK
jgi:hypothetical protein